MDEIKRQNTITTFQFGVQKYENWYRKKGISIMGNRSTRESIANFWFSHRQKSSKGRIPIRQKIKKSGAIRFPILLKLVLPGIKIRKAPIIMKIDIAVNLTF